MAEIVPLTEAVQRGVQDGVSIAMEGFTHLIPFAAGHEIIRQRRRGLALIRMTPDIIYDQMIGMGCANSLVFSWAGNPGIGSLHRFRDAVENGWPSQLDLEEHTHAGMANRYAAGAAGLPYAVLRGYEQTTLLQHTQHIAGVACPFTGERLIAVAALNPDVGIIHAQQADRSGNVHLWGITGVQKETVLAAQRVIVTVEEVVDAFVPRMGSIVLPHWLIDFVSVVRNGAHPSYAAGYSERDNSFYQDWDSISRDRDRFASWMNENILR